MHEIRVVECCDNRREEWNRFVAESNNGTIFHNLDFLNYHPSGRFRFRHLMFYEGDSLVALLPGGTLDGAYRSPFGASFGGFATRTAVPLAQADAIVKAFVEWCNAQGLRQAHITPPMQVYSRTFDETMEYALLYNGFTLGNALYSSVIDLTRIRSKHDLSRNTRHKINKAINKHVRIEQSTDLDAFYPILLENKAKFNTRPTHTLDELRDIERLLPGMMTLFMAYHEQTPIAGELLFAANQRCVLNFYTMHRYHYHDLYPVNYLVEHAIRWSVSQGFVYYDYGVSADTSSANPLEPSWSLVRYKESMGSSGCIRKSFTCVF